MQLLLPFTDRIEKENARQWWHVPFFDNPKDLNETLLNLQYEWLINQDKKAWARLWQLSIGYAESEILHQKQMKGFKLASDEKEDKALNAVEYVLRRYCKNPGWCVRKSFISQLYGGVMHALWSMNMNQKFDAAVEYIDYEESLGNTEAVEVTWNTRVHGFSMKAFSKEGAMEFQEVIKKYLEETAAVDSAIAAVYSEEKLGACCDYIRAQAKKQAKNSCACIEDAVVYKWARDFMLGDIAPEDKKSIVKPGKKDTSRAPGDDFKTDAEIEDEKHNYIKPFGQNAVVVKKSKHAEDPAQLKLFEFGADDD